MIKHILPILFLIFLNYGNSQDYLWPTEASGDISSNFGEFRDGRFHMGIDIKTAGKTGYPIYAIEDGYISRIVTNYRGYGKAVYLKTNSGHTATYAHLDKFSEKVRSVVKLQQKKNGKYHLDQSFKPTTFTVKKGDIIGFTGNTGNSFGPHLHFELRNDNEQPLNPLSNGIPFKDTRKPLLEKLAIIPLYPGSKVNSNPLPQTFPLYMERGGTYFFPDTLHIDGTVGFAILMHDRREGVSNKYQAKTVELIIDGETKFLVNYELIDFNESYLMNTVHDNRLARLNLGSFQNLYRSPGLPPISLMDKDRTGIMSMAPGFHNIEIVVTDHYGNNAVFKGTVIQSPPIEYKIGFIKQEGPKTKVRIEPLSGSFSLSKVTAHAFTPFGYAEKQIKIHSIQKDTAGATVVLSTSDLNRYVIQLNCENEVGAFGFPLHATFVKPYEPLDSDLELKFSISEGGIYLQADTRKYINGDVSIRIVKPGGIIPVKLKQVRPTVYLSDLQNPALLNLATMVEIHITSPTGADQVIRQKLKPVYIPAGSEKLVLSNDTFCSIKTIPSTLYKPSVIWIEDVDTTPVKPEKSKIVSRVYQLQPFELAARDTFQVAIRLDEKASNLNNVDLYYYDAKEESWAFLKTSKKRNNSVLIAAHDRFDAVVAIQDVEKPQITWSYPANGSHYQYFDVKVIKVKLDDNLSGIDPTEEGLVMKLDGNKILPEYQPIEKELKFELAGDLGPGGHEIELEIRDRAGNINKTIIEFSVN